MLADVSACRWKWRARQKLSRATWRSRKLSRGNSAFARPAKSVSGVGFVRSRLTETPDEPKGEKTRVVQEQPSALSARHTERRRDGSGCLMANPKTTLYVGACPRRNPRDPRRPHDARLILFSPLSSPRRRRPGRAGHRRGAARGVRAVRGGEGGEHPAGADDAEKQGVRVRDLRGDVRARPPDDADTLEMRALATARRTRVASPRDSIGPDRLSSKSFPPQNTFSV